MPNRPKGKTERVRKGAARQQFRQMRQAVSSEAERAEDYERSLSEDAARNIAWAHRQYVLAQDDIPAQMKLDLLEN